MTDERPYSRAGWPPDDQGVRSSRRPDGWPLGTTGVHDGTWQTTTSGPQRTLLGGDGPGDPGDAFAPVHSRRPGDPGRNKPTPRKRLLNYPRAGHEGWTRWLPSLRLMITMAVLGIVAVFTTFFVAYAVTEIPAEHATAKAQVSIAYYKDGKTELGRFYQPDGNRTNVPLSKVPEHVQQAVLAAEDRTFYTNSGVSPTGLARAFWSNVRGGEQQGGSTITQQYVKNLFLTSERSYSRKTKEFLIALKINQQRSKSTILEGYLNTIHFGRGANGIQAAAQTYFKKNASQLTVSEGAFLAGIIKGPRFYDPVEGAAEAAAARARWNFVLDGMVSQGWLDQAKRPLRFPKVEERRVLGGRGGSQQAYLMDMVRRAAAEEGFDESRLNSGGLRIVTTFDKPLIDHGVQAVRNTLGPRNTWPRGTQAAMATIDPETGAVLAIYGGNGRRSQNAATQDIAEAGSTFKPFGLIAFLEGRREPGNCAPVEAGTEGYSLRSRFNGRSPQRFPHFEKKIDNFGGAQFGMINVSTATAHSVNTVYAAINEKVGPQHTRDVAVCAGLPPKTQGLDENYSNILGPSSPHPIDMASAYATIAAKGVYREPYWISRIHPYGEAPRNYSSDDEERFDEGVIADATYAMQQVVRRGSGAYARSLGRPAAGKTGTSEGNRSAWFVGFTPQMSTAVAMYRIGRNGEALPLRGWGPYAGREITGGSYPVQLWTAFMSTALRGEPVVPFPRPALGGEDLNPRPTPTTTPSPTGLPSPSPTTPSPTPSVTLPSPTPSVTRPTPTVTRPTPSVTLPTPSPPPPPPDED